VQFPVLRSKEPGKLDLTNAEIEDLLACRGMAGAGVEWVTSRFTYTTCMARLTIYLTDDVELRVRKAAKAAKVSVSKWVANRVTQSVETSGPPEFVALAGAFPDFPTIGKLRRGYGEDARRES
jgi:hypothetical protein